VIAAVVQEVFGFAWTLVSFLLALGIIVAVHEYGHYIVGRWSGIKAEVFSLGFGPVVATCTDRHGTRWQLAAVPFGGFVRFKGDQDAASVQSAGTSGLTAQELRQTMAGAPLWARFATVIAGPLFNFILAFVIFFGLINVSGLPADRAIIEKLYPLPFAQALQVGDEIVAIDGQPTPDMAALNKVINDTRAKTEVTYRVLRGGAEIEVTGRGPLPARAETVHLQNAAFDAGIQSGDVIVALNGEPVYGFAKVHDRVLQSGGAPLTLRIWRDGEGEKDVTLTPNRRDLPLAEGGFETRWLIGITPSLAFETQRRSVGLLEATRISFNQIGAVVEGTFSGLAHMIRGQISTCNLSGPLGLASTMGEAATSGVETFIIMLAMVSLGVGIFNLLPVPVLDGGHLVFFAYEAITRRKPSVKVMNMAAVVGIVMVLTLMLFAIGNDLVCV
jgi:regulator of sigma E protease